jgi:SAM-dependent methyltransferase
MGIVTLRNNTGAGRYFLPEGYMQGKHAQYFLDDASDGVVWQPDVYPLIADIASRQGRDVIIDVGCGRAGKLVPMAAAHPEWHYIGIDHGENLAWCATHLTFGHWIDADLEKAQELPIAASTLARAVVVCSDVLEHLLRPDNAVDFIKTMLRSGAGPAVFSTPAREERAGLMHLGPPSNPSHVREWASTEFETFFRAGNLVIEESSLTRSDYHGGGLTTQLVVARLAAQEDGQPGAAP